jgi:hypothetical protein
LTVVVVAAPTPVAAISSFTWVLRFTHAEWKSIWTAGGGGGDVYARHFLDALLSSQNLDINDPTIQDFVGNYAVTKSWLTAARATAILDTTGLSANPGVF